MSRWQEVEAQGEDEIIMRGVKKTGEGGERGGEGGGRGLSVQVVKGVSQT